MVPAPPHKYQPTREDVLSALTGQQRPWSTGDIVYEVAVLQFDAPGSVEKARELVSFYRLTALVEEMATSGALVARQEPGWTGPRPRRSGSTLRRRNTFYYALPETAAAWDAEARAKEAAKRNARAHELATAALIAAHADEYDQHHHDALAKLNAEAGEQ